MIELFQSIFAPPRHLILVLAALWVGLALAEKRTERHHVSKESLNNLVFFSLMAYLAGGRLIYALLHLPAFVQSPSSLISLNLDLFDPLAGLLMAVAAGWMYASRHNLHIRSTLDALTPFAAALAVGVALSHLAAGTAFGRPTDSSWGVELWGAVRHPSQIYQLAASLLIFCLIWFRKTLSPPGMLFLIFTALTAAARLFLEGFRGDSTLVMGGWRVAQVIAWIVLATALFVSERLLREARDSGI
ncbi:MAG TPA: prolipoprotein diacylglyceryl transferase family protein [Anaerolineales bacterium]|nr:prolipoprotein diacylglyceryl transferase family protein [Anaerolineales bacterium]